MTPRPNVNEIIKRLHGVVDAFEPTLQFSLDNGMFPVARVTFSNTTTGKPAYTLVVGFDEPDHDISDKEE
jgi:hypothetical protein